MSDYTYEKLIVMKGKFSGDPLVYLYTVTLTGHEDLCYTVSLRGYDSTGYAVYRVGEYVIYDDQDEVVKFIGGLASKGFTYEFIEEGMARALICYCPL